MTDKTLKSLKTGMVKKRRNKPVLAHYAPMPALGYIVYFPKAGL